MENSLLMSLMALLLLGVGEGAFENSSTNTSAGAPHNYNYMTSSVPLTPCSKTIYNNITEFVLARMRVKKESPCTGQLFLYYLNQSSVPLCFKAQLLHNWGKEMCKDMRCGDFKSFMNTKQVKGVQLESNGTSNRSPCSGLQIICEDTLGSELAAYKAITGILIFLILGVIFVRFSQPTYKAIRKRFSQKQQNRWVGPTQSQSVSYHRGQGPPNNNTLKRQSFPGLERLTVNTSREPSSNRNSDYDSYGYN